MLRHVQIVVVQKELVARCPVARKHKSAVALTSEAQSAGSSRKAHLLLQMAQPAGGAGLEAC